MFGFSIRSWQKATSSAMSPASSGPVGPPKPEGTRRSKGSAEVGEIDTRAPFRSVKAAVSLFGDSAESPKPSPAHRRSKSIEERVLEKEAVHQMTIKQLDKLKEKLRSLEATKGEALCEMDKANRTLEELTNKLERVRESKQAAIMATEASKKRLKELEEQKLTIAQAVGEAWKLDVDSERKQHKASTAELSSAEQELRNLRQVFDAALEAKSIRLQEALNAQHSAQVNREKETELLREIYKTHEALERVKLASQQAQEQHTKLVAEKEAQIRFHKKAKEEIDRKIRSLKEEPEPGLNKNLERELEETNKTITVLQEQLNNFRAIDVNSLEAITSELGSARKKLQEVTSEESSLRTLVGSLKLKLDNAKREHFEAEKAAAEAETAAENMQIDLESSKKEIEAINAGEIKWEDTTDKTYLTIQQLSSEAEDAMHEAEELKKNVVLLKQEANAARLAAKQMEEQLQIALKEAKEAKAAEKLADNRIHDSSRTDAAHATNSESPRMIKLSTEDYEALRKKVEQSKADADIKVATARAQVDTIRANEKKVRKKLKASQKKNRELKAAIHEATKQAEMSEAAKHVLEGELRRRREKNRMGSWDPHISMNGHHYDSWLVREPRNRILM